MIASDGAMEGQRTNGFKKMLWIDRRRKGKDKSKVNCTDANVVGSRKSRFKAGLNAMHLSCRMMRMTSVYLPRAWGSF